MSKKSLISSFADKPSLGFVTIILGVSELYFLSKNIFLALFLSIISMIFGFLALKVEVEKIDKILAVIGIIISLILIIYISFVLII